jgi:HD-GYP domain-containing protein (c-di-GMP phosphodiesterase class II)
MTLALAGLALVLGAVALLLFLRLRAVEAEIRQARETLLHISSSRSCEPSDLASEVERRLKAETELDMETKRVKDALLQTVRAVALTVETRDSFTAGHQQRVAKLASAIAQDLGMTDFEIEGIYLAGLVHDIGMIYVPSEIANRPGPLSPLEFDIVKVHPKVGHDILSTVNLPWPLARTVLLHHRRLDGSGYPADIDELMPLEACILNVADVVEAMCSHRPYRPAPGKEAALSEIETGRGVRYDERVVDACLKLFREKNFSFID